VFAWDEVRECLTQCTPRHRCVGHGRSDDRPFCRRVTISSAAGYKWVAD